MIDMNSLFVKGFRLNLTKSMFSKFKKFNLQIIILVIASFLGIGSALFWKNYHKTEIVLPKDFYGVKILENTRFPNLDIKTYGNSIELTSYLENKKVLLVLLSSSCQACEKELEVLQAVNLNKDFGIEVVFVGSDDEDSISKFLSNYKIEKLSFDDRSAKIRDYFGLQVTPVNFLINNGKIERTWNGNVLNIKDLLNKLDLPN